MRRFWPIRNPPAPDAFSLARAGNLADGCGMDQRPWTILCVGDSITEGGAHACYRPALAKALGERAIFVGPRPDAAGLRHAGFSGQSAEFVAERFEAIYRAAPADILLLHAGHNHDAAEAPIPGILAATRSIIETAREINPAATILLAQVILAGKLPKYAYLPELNAALAGLAAELDVILVDQASGWDWRADTVEDLVHPSEAGAAKMAATWQCALRPILENAPPAAIPVSLANLPAELAALPTTEGEALQMADRVVTYRVASGVELKLHIYLPPGAAAGELRPGILFIHGGGWRNGSPAVHAQDCVFHSRRGMVAATASYRLIPDEAAGFPPGGTRVATSPLDCLADARAALRWFRGHAAELGLDPHRVVCSGGSAGGHLVAAFATFPGRFEEPGADTSVSCQPNALLLLYPAFDLVDGWVRGGNVVERSGLARDAFSPAQHVPAGMPPSLILSGAEDDISTPLTNARFVDRVRALGGASRFVEFAGRDHKLFERHPENPHFQAALWYAADFLAEIGYQSAPPTWPRPEIPLRLYP